VPKTRRATLRIHPHHANEAERQPPVEVIDLPKLSGEGTVFGRLPKACKVWAYRNSRGRFLKGKGKRMRYFVRKTDSGRSSVPLVTGLVAPEETPRRKKSPRIRYHRGGLQSCTFNRLVSSCGNRLEKASQRNDVYDGLRDVKHKVWSGAYGPSIINEDKSMSVSHAVDHIVKLSWHNTPQPSSGEEKGEVQGAGMVSVMNARGFSTA